MTFDATDRLTFQFNVNNLFNNASPTKVGVVGTIPSTMTEADFIAQYPNALSTVQVNAPRAFFFTASARFRVNARDGGLTTTAIPVCHAHLTMIAPDGQVARKGIQVDGQPQAVSAGDAPHFSHDYRNTLKRTACAMAR